MLDLINKNILVLGLKKSGLGAIRLLKTIQTNIFISDKNLDLEIEGTITLNYEEVINYLSNIDIIVKSPGIPSDNVIIKSAIKRNIIIISEIELAYHFLDNNKVIVGITGTNGKTTTTKLVTEILQASNISCVSCGNIGNPFSDCILDYPHVDVYILELSSFQLEHIIYFKPHICIILNLNKAHLDYHKSFKKYLQAKLNILKNHHQEMILIYNYDDKLVRNKVRSILCQKYCFSLSSKRNVYLIKDEIMYNGYSIINKADIKLKGNHNLSNLLAATLTAKIFYIENQIIKNTLTTFTNLPHRLEFVAKVDGVSYYNDSKATNIEATLSALNTFQKPVIIILGGVDRKQKFTKIIKHQMVKFIIGIGETKEKILRLANKYQKPCVIKENLLMAFNLAKHIAKANDIVLLSPASASFDEFNNYEERGNYFKKLIKNLQKDE